MTAHDATTTGDRMTQSTAPTVPVLESHRFDVAALERYMREHVRGFRPPIEVSQFLGGQSNPTYHLRTGDAEYVLRRKPPGKLLPSAHAVDREYRVMTALGDTGVPVPRTFALCEDPEVLGTAFFIMEYVPGRILSDPLMPELTASERGALWDSMNDVLAHLHLVDWRAVGLEGFGRPGNYFARQIHRWTRQWQASKTREIPAMERLIEWLPANVPEGDETRVVHGDFRLGNLMLDAREPRVIALLDWELSTLGHPLADLAYNCLVWHATPAMYGGIEGLDLAATGIPPEAAYVARYCERAGRADGVTAFHLAFAMFRMAVIFEGIAQRARIGTAAGADAEQVGRLSIDYAERALALIDG